MDDFDNILSHRHDLGADFWLSPDKNFVKGSPFSFLESIHYLLELKTPLTDPIIKHSSDLLLSAWREDGRFRLIKDGAIYPCHTASALRLLAQLGKIEDPRLQKTRDYLFEKQEADGGWRCLKFSYGRGPETEYSNPFPTLMILDALRYTKEANTDARIQKAVVFLLAHWTIKVPLGPCHYGIGTRFMLLEYPFRTYNLFYYVYVLSFYETARHDPRFLEALEQIKQKCVNNQIIIEKSVPKLSTLAFCKKGEASEHATNRFKEILRNMDISIMH